MPEPPRSASPLPVVNGSDASPRAAARLDQVVCTLEGMAALLQDTPGDFAVVVHGDRDCLNVLVQGMDHPGAERFFGTHLQELEAVGGQGAARLRECVEAVCTELRPVAVFLLGTCLSALLGEDDARVAREAGRAAGVEVIALEGAGMGFVTQGAILDRFACLVLAAALGLAPEAGEAPDPHGVCLLGFDPGPEVRHHLAQLGIPVRAVLDRGTPLAHWQRLPGARRHVVLDQELFPGLLATLRGQYGQETLEVPYPVGSQATDRFFAAIGEAAGGGGHGAAFLAPAAAAAREAVSVARQRCAGVRLGYNLGSMKNLHPRTLARVGLTDLVAFEELGFEPVLLVQGDDRPARLEALRETLDRLGCQAPFVVFSDTVFFGEICRAEGCGLVYASDHLREQAASAGVGLLPFGALEPGYGQVAANIARILDALGRAG